MTAPKAPAALSIRMLTADPNKLPQPNAGPYFLIGKKGAYIYKNSHFGRIIRPVDELPTLSDLLDDNGKPTPAILWATLPKMPQELFGKALSFFASVWHKQHTEAMVDITWSEKQGYRLFVPKQKASGGHVECQRKAEHYEQDSRIVGTIHSHCNFSAFHSGTDESDAKEHDGLHITLGNVDSAFPSVAAMISDAGNNWKVEPKDLMEMPLKPVPHPDWWMDQIEAPMFAVGKKTQAKDKRTATKTTSLVPLDGGRGNGTSHPPISQIAAQKRLTGGNASTEDYDESDEYEYWLRRAFMDDEFDRTEERKQNRITPIRLRKNEQPTIEEVFATYALTGAQDTVMTDSLSLLAELDYVLAAAGLRIDYSLIEGTQPAADQFREYTS